MTTAYKTFETDRLFIRPVNSEDLEFIVRLFNTPKWHHYIGNRNVHSPEEAQRYIDEKMTPQLETLGYGNYTVLKKDDGQKIGTCGLYNREGLEDIDLGFAFLPQYEKQGFAYESSKRLLDAAFDEFAMDTVLAITTQDNFSSQRLLKKLGLHTDGLTTLPGSDEEIVLYKIKRENRL